MVYNSLFFSILDLLLWNSGLSARLSGLHLPVCNLAPFLAEYFSLKRRRCVYYVVIMGQRSRCQAMQHWRMQKPSQTKRNVSKAPLVLMHLQLLFLGQTYPTLMRLIFSVLAHDENIAREGSKLQEVELKLQKIWFSMHTRKFEVWVEYSDVRRVANVKPAGGKNNTMYKKK